MKFLLGKCLADKHILFHHNIPMANIYLLDLDKRIKFHYNRNLVDKKYQHNRIHPIFDSMGMLGLHKHLMLLVKFFQAHIHIDYY